MALEAEPQLNALGPHFATTSSVVHMSDADGGEISKGFTSKRGNLSSSTEESEREHGRTQLWGGG